MKLANYVPDRKKVEIEEIEEDGTKTTRVVELNEFDDLSYMQQLRFEAMWGKAEEMERRNRANPDAITEEDSEEHKRLMEEMAVLAIRLPEEEVRAMRNRLQVGLVTDFLLTKQRNDPAAQVRSMQWLQVSQALLSQGSQPDSPQPTKIAASKSGSKRRR